jgi:hypothetical protein
VTDEAIAESFALVGNDDDLTYWQLRAGLAGLHWQLKEKSSTAKRCFSAGNLGAGEMGNVKQYESRLWS